MNHGEVGDGGVAEGFGPPLGFHGGIKIRLMESIPEVFGLILAVDFFEAFDIVAAAVLQGVGDVVDTFGAAVDIKRRDA